MPNQSLTDVQRKAYEEYLKAQSPAQQDEALKKLVPGTLQHYYAHMLHRLKLTKGRITSDDEKTLENFRKKFEHTEEYREVKYRKQLLDYDIETDQSKKASLLRTIGYSTLGLNNLATKPAYLSEVGRAESSEEESKQDLS